MQNEGTHGPFCAHDCPCGLGNAAITSDLGLSPAPAPLKELERMLRLHPEQTSFILTRRELEAVSALSPQPPTSELQELFTFIGVTNLKDAKKSITGLRERIKFTETFEELRDFPERPVGSPQPPSEARK